MLLIPLSTVDVLLTPGAVKCPWKVYRGKYFQCFIIYFVVFVTRAAQPRCHFLRGDERGELERESFSVCFFGGGGG